MELAPRSLKYNLGPCKVRKDIRRGEMKNGNKTQSQDASQRRRSKIREGQQRIRSISPTRLDDWTDSFPNRPNDPFFRQTHNFLEGGSNVAGN